MSVSVARNLDVSPTAYNAKFFDVTIGSGNLSHNTFLIGQTPDILFAPTPGPDENDRVGKRTQLIEIDIRAKIEGALIVGNFAAGDYRANLVRYIVFVDNNANAAKPTAADLLVNPKAGSIHSFCLKNRDYKKRFNHLFDKVYMLGASSVRASKYTSCEGRNSYMVRQTIKCNIDTVYNSAVNGDERDITSGAVYQLCLGMYATATADPTMAGQIGMTYYDA